MNPQHPLTRGDQPSTNSTVTGEPSTDAFPHAPKLSAAPPWSLRHAGAAPVILIAAAFAHLIVAMVVLTPLGALPGSDDKTGEGVLASACLVTGGFATAWLLTIWRHKRPRPRLTDFALVRSPKRKRAVIGWTAGAGVALMLANAGYSQMVSARQGTIEVVQDAHGARLAALTVLAVVLAPLNEELLSRGVIYAGLRSWRGPWASIPLSVVPYAVIHAEPKFMPLMAAAGVAFAVVREKTGSLAPVIALHSLLNAGALCLYSPRLTAALAAPVLVVCALIALRPSRRRQPTASPAGAAQ